MTIITEKLTSQEIIVVQKFIHDTPNIVFYSHKELLGMNAIKLYVSNQFAGFCLLKNIGWSGNYSEIAVLGVLEQFQNQGFGRKLFDAGIDQIRHTKIYSKKIYTVSRNPKVIKMMKKYDFAGIYNVLNLPVEINIDSFWYFCNFMRLKEIIRKYFYYKNQSKFWYGVRL